MKSIKKQLEPTQFKEQELHKSAGILDDFSIRKNVATRGGTIEKVPVNNSDIANKKYVDNAIAGVTETDPVAMAYLDQAVKVASSPQFAKVKTPIIYPASDSTTAVQINKADGTTNVLNVNTTNSCVGIKSGAIATAELMVGGDMVISGYIKGFNIASPRIIMFIDGTGTIIRSGDNDPTDGIHFQKRLTPFADIVTMLDTGNVGIGTTAPDKALEINHATGQNLRLTYNDSNGSATTKTDFTTDSTGELTITSPTAKTPVFSPTVYKDTNVGGMILSKPSASAPGLDNFRTSAGTDTTIPTYAFANDEYLSGAFEIQHDYKETTDLIFHVHFQIIAAPTGTDNVQWRLTYSILRDGVTLAAVTTIDSPDVAVDTQYRAYRADFVAIAGASLKIGDQLVFNLYRVASTGDGFAGDALIETAGIHYQIDTLGSRSITSK